MKKEIDAALKFILKLIKQNSDLSDGELARFQHSLRIFLTKKFVNHWHPERPWQGQGYRCLRLNGLTGKEPTISKAASECGLEYSNLKLPLELTVWVDPGEVSCRFGEHKGSYCTVASFQDGKKQNYIDLDLFKVTRVEKENNCMKTKYTRRTNPTMSPLGDMSSKENRGAATHQRPPLPISVLNSPITKAGQIMPQNLNTCKTPVSYLDPSDRYKPSWIRIPTPASPSHSSYPSNEQYAIQVAAQENLNNLNLNKFSWNSNGFYNPQGNEWYSHSGLALA